MMSAVCFYWTLPVPWAQFTSLPDDINQAILASRTIRYQHEVVHRHARNSGFQIISEKVFLELAPDRGSLHIREALQSLEAIGKRNDATLLYVDFWRFQHWRAHTVFESWIKEASIACEAVPPDPIYLDGSEFDPFRHFRNWRAIQEEWTRGKSKRITLAKNSAVRLKQQGATYSEIAAALNSQSIRSASGKPWSGESVRKLLGRESQNF